MKHKITLIPGDGIGPEVTTAAIRIIEAAGVNVQWEKVQAGMDVISTYGKPLPDEVLKSIRRNKIALKGPLTTLVAKGFSSANVELRKTLDLYANVRPVKNMPGIKSRYQNVDIIVIRENTEDLYSGIEHLVAPGVTESLKIITHRASKRIAKFAFNYAKKYGRKKITAVHKANIMKLTDGLFLECAREEAKKHSHIEYEEKIVDNLAMQLVMNPENFDILLLGNLYGDIVSDLCAGLVGGLGVVPGANIGEKYKIFESVHGSAPDIAGKNIANPIAMILSSVMMLDYIGEHKNAQRIMSAITDVVAESNNTTPDLGGTATTTQFTDKVIDRLKVH